MAQADSIITGKVKSVKDEQSGKTTCVDDQGRVFVEFPWLGGKQGYWAPVATAMAGKERGTWLMPETGDEVLVAFDRGDVNHPYILGFLWNGKATPPEIDPNKRLIKSKKGHTILLDDSDKQEKIVLTTGGGMSITMDDPAKTITIKATQSVVIEGPAEVTVKGSKAVTVESSGEVKVKAASVTVESSGEVTVKAASVTVNSSSIKLGEGAEQPAVLGTDLMTYLTELVTLVKTHVHVGATGPVSPSIILEPLPTPPATLLSKVIQEA